MSEALLTTAEVAKQLRISPRHLRDLTNDGLLRRINVGRGKNRSVARYTQEDIDEFKRKRATSSFLSTSAPAGKPTPTTSSSGAVDFLAILAQRKNETRKTSKISSGKQQGR